MKGKEAKEGEKRVEEKERRGEKKKNTKGKRRCGGAIEKWIFF